MDPRHGVGGGAGPGSHPPQRSHAHRPGVVELEPGLAATQLPATGPATDRLRGSALLCWPNILKPEAGFLVPRRHLAKALPNSPASASSQTPRRAGVTWLLTNQEAQGRGGGTVPPAPISCAGPSQYFAEPTESTPAGSSRAKDYWFFVWAGRWKG